MRPTRAARLALAPALLLAAAACLAKPVAPAPAPERVRSFPVAVDLQVLDVALDVGTEAEVREGDPAAVTDVRALRRAVHDILARDLAERGPFGVAPASPAVLRVEPRFRSDASEARPRSCRLELHAEVRDRGGALLAETSGESGGECWRDGAAAARLHLSPSIGAASDALRRALAQEAPALVARLPALAPGAAPAAAGPAPAPGPAPWLSGGAQRERRLAVLEFAGPLEPALLAAMSDEARAGALEAVRAHRVSVMTRESMQVVLAEMGKSALCVEGECEVETARNIGADLVVSGTVLRVDGVQVLTLKLHETAKGTLLATASARGKSGLEALDAVRGAAAALFR